MPKIMDIPVPQIVLEQIAEVIKASPQEPVSERNVEQTVDVPVFTEQLTDSACPLGGTRGRRDLTGASPAAHRGA